MSINIKNIQLNINRRQFVILVVDVLLVFGFFILGNVARNSKERFYSQQEAVRWEDEKNSYAQVSAFVSSAMQLQQEDVSGVRNALMETLSTDSLNVREGNGRVWIDAYSGECNTEVRRENNTLSVTAVGVGGEFFKFHPIPLLSGGYISDEDLNQDRIVVDENFAWAMFGSNDIVGMQIWMDTTIYTIAGVVEVEEDSLYQTAYGNGNRIYVPYTMLKNQQESLQVTCYEAVLPNPISNYAYYALRHAFGIEDEIEDTVKQTGITLNFDNVEVIENSKRYDWIPLWNGIRNRKLQIMRPNSVGYPFWENLAKVEELRQQNFLIWRIVLLICPFICLVLWIYGLWNRRTWTVKGLIVQGFDRIQEYQARKAEERRQEEELPENMTEDSDEEPTSGEEDAEESEPVEELHSVTSEDIFHI